MSQDPNPPPTKTFSIVPVNNNQVGSENQSSSNSNHNLTSQDCRPSRNLQDLFKLSTRLQIDSNEDPPEQLTDERAEFLRNALSAMTMDLVPEMQKKLEVLKEIQTKPESFVDANLTKYEETLEQLVELLYEIDLAQYFYQIGGLDVVAPLLRSKHASFRSFTATIVLECCKNNPFCQELSVTDEIFGPLMEMAASDPNEDARIKAIGAVSAITRSNPAAISQFNKYDGVQMVEKALNCGCEKILSKTIFLVIALCDTDEAVKGSLTESAIVETLITLLFQYGDFIFQEYILRALLPIIKDNRRAKDICLHQDVRTFLTNLCQTNTDPERQDLVELANDLLQQLNS